MQQASNKQCPAYYLACRCQNADGRTDGLTQDHSSHLESESFVSQRARKGVIFRSRSVRAVRHVAAAHGVEKPIQPADFGLQRGGAGITVATYVDETHVITVQVDRDGCVAVGVAELSWVHFPDPDPDEECWYCAQPVSMRTVYLPGDAPAEKVLTGG